MPIGLKGNNDGSGAIQIGGSDAITISTGLNTTFAGTVTATTVATSTGAVYPLSLGTAVASTSGASIDFTNIPSTAKRVIVIFSGVSQVGGTAQMIIQLGTGGTPTTSGYVGSSNRLSGSAGNSTQPTTGFGINTGAANYDVYGAMTLYKFSGNTWVASFTGLSGAGTNSFISAGAVTLSGALDMVRVGFSVADTFDAGSINIMWE